MLKKVILNILSIILLIILVLLIFLKIMSGTVLNKNYILNKILEPEYINNIKNEINSNFESYTIQSGFDNEVFNNIYTDEKLNEDIKNVVNYIYEGKSLDIEIDSIQNNLRNNIDNILKEKDYKLKNSQKEELNIYISSISNSYKNSIVYMQNELGKVSNILNKINKLIDIVFIVLVVIIFIFFIIILILQKNMKYSYIGILIIAISLTFLILTGVFKYFIAKDFLVINEIITLLFKSIIKDIVNKLLILAIVFICLGILMVNWHVKLNNKKIDTLPKIA